MRLGEAAHGGACVARDGGGRVVFVRHGLPGELVRARVTSVRNRLALADAVEVLEASPDRVPSVWPDAGPAGVGGAELAHVAPCAQRRWKADVVRGQLRRIGGQELWDAVDAIGGVEVLPAPGDMAPDDPLLQRRTRIEVVIDHDGRPAMARHRGHDLVPLTSMPLAVRGIEDLDLFSASSPWAGLWRPGSRVRALAPTGDSPHVLVGRQLFDSQGCKVRREVLDWVVEVGGQVRHFAVRPAGFWQTHREGAGVLAQGVLDAAKVAPGDRVMELYSGAGLFSLFLAESVGPRGRVLTLEGDEGAVVDARANTASQAAVETCVGRVDRDGVADLAGELGARADLVVLDPPRIGAGAQVCEAIAATEARRVVLVSCDPAAGARDLASLVGAGYVVESLRAWDLFPHTHHVEFIAGLVRP
ncbi:class I SAM-dependent RNA methyltransferase [Schaalia sp. 19OD2882]|uniref:class I SAM-dependent RNA methyltransferase n=1 Tax=Schaalia sp. 19OD2882 TaxID=2794089 RepID=UPI0020A80D8A|nr:TRAM domain-containing protein [Schaalia sp. 19OD2882]